MTTEKVFIWKSEAMRYVPEELIRKILLCLPVKSLLRFRSVSKLWLSLISNPDFAKSHFDRSFMDADRLIYIAIAASEACSIDCEASLHDDSSVIKLNFPLTPPYGFDVLGSCRGFLLLSHFKNLFIWNPSSGACKTLSYPTPSATHPLVYGFCYDDSTDDYWVILPFFAAVQLFSLKSNSWKEIEGTHFPYITGCTIKLNAGITLHGTIHWFIGDLNGGSVILGFDLTARAFWELPMPEELDTDLGLVSLEILGGCLSLSDVYASATEIWIMKEYGVESSWTKSIIVFAEDLPYGYFRPICSTKGGDIIGISNSSDGLMKFNREGELLEHRAFDEYGITYYCHESEIPGEYDDEYGIHLLVCTASLLSLPNYREEGGEDYQH